MKTRSALARLPAADEVREVDSAVGDRHGEDRFGVVGVPTITLYVSEGRANESEEAFRALETVGLAFAVAPAGGRQVRAEWGGRVFTGAAGVERLAASLRAFRDDLARLNGPAGDPRIKERAASRYRQQLQQAREQFKTILNSSRP